MANESYSLNGSVALFSFIDQRIRILTEEVLHRKHMSDFSIIRSWELSPYDGIVYVQVEKAKMYKEEEDYETVSFPGKLVWEDEEGVEKYLEGLDEF